MNLADFRANGAFSQRTLEQTRESERGSIQTPSMFEPILARSADGRVAQAPSLRKISGVPLNLIFVGQKRPERENRQIH